MLINASIRREVGIVGLIRKVPCANPLLKPKVFLESPQIQRPTIPSQNLQIPSIQRVIRPTSVERNITHLNKHLQFIILPKHKIFQRERERERDVRLTPNS